MKIVSYDHDRIGILTPSGVVDVTDLAGVTPGFWPPIGMVKFIAHFGASKDQIDEAIRTRPAKRLDLVRLEAPVRWPNKVIAFPANYYDHIEEMKKGSGVISRHKASGQGFFLKSNSSISGPADPIVLPPLANREIHHECELAIIIGKGGRGISRSAAREHIFGFSCLLDMVVRGTEERVMRKSFDTFCPLGPWIATADEIADTSSIRMMLRINGDERQSASTTDLIVDIPEMIAMSSSVMTLEPGDIIATGTPAGVGPVRDGDVVEIEISGVGSMRLPVIQGTIGDHSVWSSEKEAVKI
jgi:2-keto-4-pentenoate hydratase/2-oxohepta-3-ene-1,7-dioic acid hydratase in catechol pathway